MSAIAVEAICLREVREYCAPLTSADKIKKSFKTVNAMLQVMDRDGLYGTVVYLEAYGRDDIGLLSRLNSALQKAGLDSEQELASSVGENNLEEVKKIYAGRFCGDDAVSRAAEMILRRLLVHLRYALKAKGAQQ